MGIYSEQQISLNAEYKKSGFTRIGRNPKCDEFQELTTRRPTDKELATNVHQAANKITVTKTDPEKSTNIVSTNR